MCRDVFSAGASHYGVADLELLAKETHKFESRYLDGLIGPYPEAKDIYIQRSPIHRLDTLKAPTAFFQVGLYKCPCSALMGCRSFSGGVLGGQMGRCLSLWSYTICTTIIVEA